MDSQENLSVITALAERVGDSADAGATAIKVVAIWRDIDSAFTPVLGTRGVAAIYKRSLHLTTDHPWLMRMHEDIEGFIDLDGLGNALREQSSADACSGARALLASFCALLTTLIGTALTERLFRSVLANTTTATDLPPQDPAS